MFSTSFGSFNGAQWESMCQIIFKRKYMSVSYITIKASPGDFGLEGFTRDGSAFQCYCPDFNLDARSLYEKQRDKITTDLKKLSDYENELVKLLGGTKIKKWILVTPRIGHLDLTIHCNKKRDEVKSWNLSIIDPDFDVLVYEIEDYAHEIGEYFSSTRQRFAIAPSVEDTSDEKVIEWQNSSIDLIKNANEKNTVRISSLTNPGDLNKKVNDLTDLTARSYLNGESILRVWQSSQPENHQRFMELMASVESELREQCLLNEVDPNSFITKITTYMESKIKSAFPFLDESTVVRLKQYAVSAWLFRCPLYFETTVNEN